MTKKELSQCYWLNREIEHLQDELLKLDGAEYKTANLTGMPRGGEISDNVSKLATQRAELHRLVSLKLEECMIARVRIERYIDSVEDSEIRLILRLRHINGLSWTDMSTELNYSERHMQRLYKEYFKKQKMS